MSAITTLLAASVLTPPLQTQGPDIVLILLDDIGIDVLEDNLIDRGGPTANYSYPKTAALNEIRDHGIRFRQAWVNDVCSPTRSAIQTGRYAFRTGIGSQIIPDSSTDFSLPASEHLIPEMLDLALGDSAYLCAIFGKWHMQKDSLAYSAPVDAGYEHFDGNLFALNIDYCSGFSKILHTEGGTPTVVSVPSGVFLLSDQVDSCQTWIDTQTALSASQALFVYLALQAPYELHKVPDTDLFTVDGTHYPRMDSLDNGLVSCAECTGPAGGEEISYRRECYTAMVEAIDTEIAGLLTSLDARAQTILNDPAANWWDTTTIIFLGDNGTPANGVIEYPFPVNQGKDSAYEGGIHVPMYIAGPEVPIDKQGDTCDALVNGVDLFATIASIAGVFDQPGIDSLLDLYPGVDFDSVDLTPLLLDPTAGVRDWVYSENWSANTDQVPFVLGETRVIMGRYDDGTGDGSLGLYKLWVSPKQFELRYQSNGYYYGDKFFEISKDDGNLVTDEFEAANLVNGDPTGMEPHQEAAYFALRTELKTLLGY